MLSGVPFGQLSCPFPAVIYQRLFSNKRDETKEKIILYVNWSMPPDLELPVMDVLLWQVFGISDFLLFVQC